QYEAAGELAVAFTDPLPGTAGVPTEPAQHLALLRWRPCDDHVQLAFVRPGRTWLRNLLGPADVLELQPRRPAYAPQRLLHVLQRALALRLLGVHLVVNLLARIPPCDVVVARAAR